MIHRNYLEFDVVAHCTLRCAGCGHHAQHAAPEYADLETFVSDINALARVMHVAEFRLLGGEPLLHPRISEFVIAAKASGIADVVALCTNGQLIYRAHERLLANIDRIDVSIYPGSGVDYSRNLDALERWKSAYGFKVSVSSFDRFNHIHRSDPLDMAGAQQVYAQCRIAHEFGCHVFKAGRYFKCIVPTIQARRLREIGVDDVLDYESIDGVELHAPDLEQRLRRYLDCNLAMHCCSYCNGLSGPTFPHYQEPARKVFPLQQQ